MSAETISDIGLVCGVIGLFAINGIMVILVIRDCKSFNKLKNEYRSAIAKAEEAQLFYHEALKDLKSKNRCEGDEWKDG